MKTIAKETRGGSGKLRSKFSTILIYLELILVAIIVLYPLLWVLGSSLNPEVGIARATAIPTNPTLDNYVNLFTETKYPQWYQNTFYVATLTMIFAVCINTITAFVFARFRFRGKKMGLLLVMVLQTFPSFMGLTALYMIAVTFKMLNNLNMLVIIYVAGSIPGNIWLVKANLLNLPRSLDEAAYIDGASKLQLFTKIILPLSLPIITFVALTSFMGPWMDYMLPRFLINKTEMRTVAIGLFDMINGTSAEFTTFCAGAVMVAIPITAIYMVGQKFLIHGLTAGANKGE